VYARQAGGRTLTFGVSGLLYRANVLMYDHQTESLWSQVKRSAVTGSFTGTKLEVLPSVLTTWGKWRKRYPQTLVLSFDTGYRRNYDRDPYESYRRNRGTWSGFLSSFIGHRLSEGDVALVAGIELGGKSRGYRLTDLREKGSIVDRLGSEEIRVSFDPATDSVSVTSLTGEKIPHVLIYWFVWKETHPEADLYQP
jgi:hypothetical protein